MKPPVLKVALPIPLRRLFDYRPPYGSEPQIGSRCLVPFGKRELVGLIVGMGEPSENYDPAKLQTAKHLLDNEPLLSPSLLQLLVQAADYYHQPVGEMIFTALPTLLRQGKPPEHATEIIWQLTEKGQHLLPEQFKSAHRQREAWQVLMQHSQGLSANLLRAFNVSTQALKGLERNQWAQQVSTISRHNAPLLTEPPLTALPEQQAAIDSINQANGFAGFLLDGITGSGKTEVYLQIAEQALARNQQVLVLVPEIGLTPQTYRRFQHRFSCRIERLHSGLTDNQRLDVWQSARLGQADIVMGTRSALFTPLPRLGLIIIDEAHDNSYKQYDGCRYHARDLALWRAKLENIPIVLGSATPSLETLYLAQQGKLTLLPLRQRAGNAQPPSLRLLDCSALNQQQLLHPDALAALTQSISASQQGLVFLNRRGYAPLINCLNCGWQAECSQCDSFMTWHRQIHRLICHHCDRQIRIPTHCPTCGSSQLGDLGAGTEKLEGYLTQQFPHVSIIRVDRDVTRRKGSMEQKLATIRQGEPAILLGTQMLAKGHHFPNLTTTIVLDADAGFLSADFRGSEQAGETILQVAGRTGRAQHKGRVLIQTRHPNLAPLQQLLSGSWSDFAQSLLKERQLMGLPPYSYAALLCAEAIKPQDALEFLTNAKQLLTTQGLTLLGPAPAPLEKRAGRFRFQILLLCSQRSLLHQQLANLMPSLEKSPLARRCRWHIDVDPQSML